MNKSDKIREHFRKNPDTRVADVAKKFDASVPMVYKLRSQVREEWKPPELLPTPQVEAITEEDLGLQAITMEPSDVDRTLSERAKEYGMFKDGAALMQGIKRLLADHAAKHGKTFADDQWEALEMIVHKIGRIVNGNPDKLDHWVDIAGYATLVAERLEGNPR
jgi:hypothetical protein